jgi:hypothetical protein
VNLGKQRSFETSYETVVMKQFGFSFLSSLLRRKRRGGRRRRRKRRRRRRKSSSL